MVDVTGKLAAQVTADHVDVALKDLVAKLPDPASGEAKVILVRYALDGEILTKMFEENAEIKLGR